MKINFNGEEQDLSMMLVSAERYALGRQTYIVEWTCSVLKDNMHLITEHDKRIMIRDIEEQEKYGYGMDMDKAQWMSLLSKLKALTKEE